MPGRFIKRIVKIQNILKNDTAWRELKNLLKYTYEFQETQQKNVLDLGGYFHSGGFVDDRLYHRSADDYALVSNNPYAMARDPEKNKSSVLPKLVLISGFFILAAAAFFLAKEFYKNRQIQNEITKLEQEAAKINRENLEIQDKIAYLQSRDYQEREAKDKLNLQNPGENVVVIKPGVAKEQGAVAENENLPQPLPPNIPNPRKWWKYFFEY